MRPIAEAEDVLALRGSMGGEGILFQFRLAETDVAAVSDAPGAVQLARVGATPRTYAVMRTKRRVLASQART